MFLVIIFIFGGYVWIAGPSWIKCYWVKYSNFQKIKHNENIYISPTITPKMIHILEERLKKAKERVKNFWGTRQANPFIIFCATESEFQYFGMKKFEVPALTHMTAWGSFIVVKPDGMTVDIIAHELMHAEILTRLGWYIKSREIPAWFDEGLALQVDYRYPFPSKNPASLEDYEQEFYKYRHILPKNPLQKLQSIQDFYQKMTNTHVAYLISGREIKRWLSKHNDKKYLIDFLNSLKNGKKFSEAYENL